MRKIFPHVWGKYPKGDGGACRYASRDTVGSEEGAPPSSLGRFRHSMNTDEQVASGQWAAIHRQRRIAWPILWASSIFATSCTWWSRDKFVELVGAKLPVANGTAKFDRFWDGYWWLGVKGWHATEYAILFGLIRMTLRTKDSPASFLVPLCICIAFAASDEYHQTFVPHRGGNVTDVMIDVGGTLIAALICLLRVAPWKAKPGVST